MSPLSSSTIRTRVAISLATWLALPLLQVYAPSARADGVAPEPVIALDAWLSPPRDARPVARWWWPGGSVEPSVLETQLATIAGAGFGGVELQPLLLGIGEDELAIDPALRTVGEPPYLARVAFAAAAAAKHGLAFDLTLGSGWPGGLPTTRANAERQLLMASVDVAGPGSVDVAWPEVPAQSYRWNVEWVLDVLGPKDEEARLVAVVAARLGATREGVPTLREARVLEGLAHQGRLRWTPPAGDWRVFCFYTNSTEHFVMGGAYPGAEADARVVDHLSRRGADALLVGYAEPLLEAAGAGKVRDVFVDSFELMGELPITEAFLSQFEARAGYDVTPHLPLLFRRGGESKYAEMMDLFGRLGGPRYLLPEPGRAERIREDYERVRRELFEEVFIARIAQWARARGLALRLQAHGGYGDVLDVYAMADVPESEGLFAGGAFDFLKLASSAAHVSGRTWASSESFITLRLLGRTLSDEEMHLLAGRAFAAGINRIVYHGVSYPYLRQDGERWFPFSGGFGRILAGPLPMSLDVDGERLARLHDFNRVLSRTSVAMSSGHPVADVAWLHTDAAFPDAASLQVGRIEPHGGESPQAAAFRARGLTHDRVSRKMLTGARVEGGKLAIGAARYRALLLDPMRVAEPGLVRSIAKIAEAGVPVLALGALPERAPGLHGADVRDARVREARVRIDSLVIPVRVNQLERALADYVAGDLVEPVAGERLDVAIARRRSAAGDVLFVFNESWSARKSRLRFVQGGGPLTQWDPASGERTVLRARVEPGEVVELALGPAGSAILSLGRMPSAVGATGAVGR
jgi:hypothetical protein